jgi:hypothetical protein
MGRKKLTLIHWARAMGRKKLTLIDWASVFGFAAATVAAFSLLAHIPPLGSAMVTAILSTVYFVALVSEP